MAFIGFLGGLVAALLIQAIYASREEIAGKLNAYDILGLPRRVYWLGLAYGVLLFILWFAFFHDEWNRIVSDDPNAGYVRIGRGLLARTETWDFIVTLLAFLAGILTVLAARHAAAGTGGSTDPAPQPSDDAGDKAAASRGVVAEWVAQLKRVTALNLLLSFALVLIAMQAFLPWVERRLETVKIGSVEASFAPLAENTRRSGSPDTPSLATKKNLNHYISVTANIDRVLRVMDLAPAIAGQDAQVHETLRKRYVKARYLFGWKVVPRVAKLYCLSELAGIPPERIPGVVETASALRYALEQVKNGNKIHSFKEIEKHLSLIDDYFSVVFPDITNKCVKIINGEEGPHDDIVSSDLRPKILIETEMEEFIKHSAVCSDSNYGDDCVDVMKNGYIVRLILEMSKLSFSKDSSAFHFKMLNQKDLDDETYEEFPLTLVDRFNLQLIKASYLADLPVETSELIASYASIRKTADKILDAMSNGCSSCSAQRKPIAGLEKDYAVYRMLGVRYVDAEAVITIGAAMMRRLPLNRLSSPDAAALEKIVSSAIVSRGEILNAGQTSDSSERWAAAALGEGIATVRYVQLVESDGRPPHEVRDICQDAKGRLQDAITLYRRLQPDDDEHRINRMRAERTLSLVENHCG